MAELHDRRELALAGRDFLVGWEAVSEAFLEHEEEFVGVRLSIVALAPDDDLLDAGVEDIRVESRHLATAVFRRGLAESLELCDGVGFGGALQIQPLLLLLQFALLDGEVLVFVVVGVLRERPVGVEATNPVNLVLDVLEGFLVRAHEGLEVAALKVVLRFPDEPLEKGRVTPDDTVVGIDEGVFQFLLGETFGIRADVLSFFRVPGALPNYLLVVLPAPPGAAAKRMAAEAALDDGREGILAREANPRPVRIEAADVGALLQNGVGLLPLLDRDDGLVVVGHVELVGLAFVVVAPLGDRIDGEGLALEQIALVLLGLEDAEDGAVVPMAGLVFGLPPPLLELAGENGRPDPVHVAVEDVTDDLGLLRVDADLLRLLVIIVAEAGVEPHELALAHHHRKALLHVLGGVLDLLLGDGRKDGDEKLALLGGGVDVLLLKTDVDPLLLEDADVVERVHGVSRDAG